MRFMTDSSGEGQVGSGPRWVVVMDLTIDPIDKVVNSKTETIDKVVNSGLR
ncbi:hypothetical protein GCM10008938_32340 [Deinococcus roseus]|uniref:Uncharacterized protein n=1 Tax=Deinococcus roseus TaxID=392414 RepID=A0ABQ2D4Z5_9DEIO|nr:hypothetical protein GCM10008938_32340 [Deinococcus roseus]